MILANNHPQKVDPTINTRILKSILAALFTAGLQTQAFAHVSQPCQTTDRKCAAEMRSQSPVKRMPYWKSAFQKPVEQRIGSAPAELVDYLYFDNITAGFPNNPQAASIPNDFLKDVSDAIAELPAQVKKLVAQKLAGIYFVRDLGGTGYTDSINTEVFGPDAGFIVLDIDVLSKSTANAWLTWKERTPFTPDPGYRLEAIIETGSLDNRRNAIQYILLHELGHILSLGEKFHPQWGHQESKIPLDRYPFALLSWENGEQNNNHYATRFEKQFPLRKDIVYYFGAKLNGGQMAAVYNQLEETNFPTLYAATSPGDDFAESFVSYVHTVLLNRPLEIHIYHGRQIAKTYRSCWAEKRCAEKRRILEELLKSR